MPRVDAGQTVTDQRDWQFPEPGALVRNPGRPDWGIGQVQSVVGHRITVNFQHAGKLLIMGDAVRLETVDPDKEL